MFIHLPSYACVENLSIIGCCDARESNNIAAIFQPPTTSIRPSTSSIAVLPRSFAPTTTATTLYPDSSVTSTLMLGPFLFTTLGSASHDEISVHACQLYRACPINQGLWRTRETRNDGSVLPQEPGRLGKKGICGGRLSFKGFVGAGKGTVEYKGCGDREGKGRWLTKPKNIVNGRREK